MKLFFVMLSLFAFNHSYAYQNTTNSKEVALGDFVKDPSGRPICPVGPVTDQNLDQYAKPCTQKESRLPTAREVAKHLIQFCVDAGKVEDLDVNDCKKDPGIGELVVNSDGTEDCYKVTCSKYNYPAEEVVGFNPDVSAVSIYTSSKSPPVEGYPSLYLVTGYGNDITRTIPYLHDADGYGASCIRCVSK